MRVMVVEHSYRFIGGMQPIGSLLFFVYWLKHITEMLLQGLDFGCSFEDFVAIDDNVLWHNDQWRSA